MNRKHIYTKILSEIIFLSIILRKNIQYREEPIHLSNADHKKVQAIRVLVETFKEQDSV